MRLRSPSSYGLNALTGNPLVKVIIQEPESGSAQLHEGNATFLHKTSNESFRAAQTDRRFSNV
jgi:hypothetical protein